MKIPTTLSTSEESGVESSADEVDADGDIVPKESKKRAEPEPESDDESDDESEEEGGASPDKRARVSSGKAEAEADDAATQVTIESANPASGALRTTQTIEEQMPGVAAHLKEHGWAVVQNVFEAEECEKQCNRMWKWHEKTSKGRFKRDDPKTWMQKTSVVNTHRIVQHYGVGHSKASWKARTNLNAVEVFARLHGTDRLTTSYDGHCLWPAPEKTPGSRWPADNVWTHVDQSPYTEGLHCVQSFATFEDVDGPNDATLQVIDGGHKDHSNLVKKHKVAPVVKSTGRPDKSDWKKFTDEELTKVWGVDWRTKKTVRISAPAGSIVLWDSRTPHQAAAPKNGRTVPRTRYVTYLCYAPVKGMTALQKKKKRDAATNNRTTTHWPLASRLFAPNPQTYGRPLPEFEVQTDGRDDTDPVVRNLCCFEDYKDTGLLGWKKAKGALLKFA